MNDGDKMINNMVDNMTDNMVDKQIPSSTNSLVVFFLSIYVGYIVYKKMGFKGNFVRYLKSRIFSHVIFYSAGIGLSVCYMIIGDAIGSNIDQISGDLVAVSGIIGSFIYSYYRSYKYLRNQVDTENAYIKMILTDIIIKELYGKINNSLKSEFGKRLRKLRRSKRSRKYKLKNK